MPRGDAPAAPRTATGSYLDYAWDRHGRLTSVTSRTSAGVKTKQVTYTYDALDRRIGKSVDLDGNGTVDQVTRFALDGAGGAGWTDDVVLTFNAAGALQHRFLHGPAVDQVLAAESGTGSVRWYLADHLGTVRDVVTRNPSNGVTTVNNHLRYDSFGRITSQTAPAELPAVAFTGRDWDADAGLYYYRARWYDPAAGRFISQDPIGFAAGDTNIQRYVGNGPTLATGPDGA